MTILHLDGGRERRGGQIQTATLLRGLAKQGIEQRLLARAPGFEEFSPAPYSAASLLSSVRRADLIHAHDARSHSLAALLCPGSRLVVSRRVAFAPRSGMLHRWKYRRPSLYLAVSEYVASALRGSGVQAERIRVVYDGLPEVAAAPQVPANNVLALRSADPSKGSALAAEACRIAGLPLRLTENLERELPAAGIFLYLSAMEGLGSALILAGFRQKPIVASRVGGIPEIVEHGRTGLLADNSPTEVAEQLRRLAEDSALARSCAEAAREQARDRFTDGRMVEQTLAAYEQVLQGAPRAS